jgi:RNA polymerase sigma factor (sigma-70 family)
MSNDGLHLEKCFKSMGYTRVDYKYVVPLVRKYVSNYSFIEVDELISVCYLAFGKATKSFNPDKGAQFSTFLLLVVRCALNSYVEKQRVDRSRHRQYSEQDGKVIEPYIEDFSDESEDQIPQMLMDLEKHLSPYAWLLLLSKLNEGVTQPVFGEEQRIPRGLVAKLMAELRETYKLLGERNGHDYDYQWK